MNLNQNCEGSLGFVVCASDAASLKKYLLASECLKQQQYYQAIYFNATSAASAFNAELDKLPPVEWLVWVHQDVLLPLGWADRFMAKIAQALKAFPRLAVVGVYGVDNSGKQSLRAGHVLDRGHELSESAAMPCRVNSLDEMLFAVRTDSGLRLDAALGFDFYATDIALTAQREGYDVAVVDAYCEHWSTTGREVNAECLVQRVVASAEVFERKWQHQFPLETPCFSITEIGDVARYCKAALE